ncbi:MAG: thiamine pyrophosphate-dependent enzyme, partial [bacterium]
VGSKSALPELHPQFIGLYQGALSRPAVRQEIEAADCVLALGVWMTDFDTGGFSVKLAPHQLISANSEAVRIGFHTYPGVRLADFISALEPLLTPRPFTASHPAHPMRMKSCFAAQPAAPLTVRRFFTRLDSFLNDDMILLVEPGDAVCAAPDLYIEEAENFIAQAYYLSIGYCTPAALGVSLARPRKRAVVLTGDGAFQMTAQELSTLLRHNCPAIFFLINNRGYMIERKLHADGPYNDIGNWQYHRLPEVLGTGAVTRRVTTEGELEEALTAALTARDRFVFIELCFPDGDCSAALDALGEKFRAMSAKTATP